MEGCELIGTRRLGCKWLGVRGLGGEWIGARGFGVTKGKEAWSKDGE